MKLTKKTLYIFGWITLVGFGGIGALMIHFFQDRTIISVITGGKGVIIQVLSGTMFGLASSWLALRIIKRDFFTPVRNFFSELLLPLHIQVRDIVFLSFCAGVGEEILFRGGVQPFLGIWLTAFVFILLHGYLNPKNWRLSVYGIVMILISGGLGYLYEYVGLISSITAHFTIDVVLFAQFLNRDNPF